MTDQNGFFKDAWKDPVWSKVISAAILGVGVFVFSLIPPNIRSLFKKFLLDTTSAQNWTYIAITAAVVAWTWILIARCSRKTRQNEHLTSDSWFNEIVRQTADCRSARIYLRGFAHPDQFRPDHRDALLKFMRLLKNRFETGADIEIVAYHYRIDEKSGLDWLKGELGENFDGLGRITLINNQPVSNSSSMYLFDSGVMLYNERDKESPCYYSQNLGGTVVHHLLEQGYGAALRAYNSRDSDAVSYPSF